MVRQSQQSLLEQAVSIRVCCVWSAGARLLLLVVRELKRQIGVVNVTKHDGSVGTLRAEPVTKDFQQDVNMTTTMETHRGRMDWSFQ